MKIDNPIFQRIWREQVYSPLARLRCLIVVGVVLSSLTLSAFYDYRGPFILAAIFIGIFTLSIIIVQPPLGIAALISVSLLLSFEIGTGTQTNLNATVLLLPLLIGIWTISFVLTPKKDSGISSRPILAGIVFIIIVLFAFLRGFLLEYRGTNAPILTQIGQLAIFVFSIGAFLLGVFQVRSLKWLERIAWLFLCLGGVYIAARLVPAFGRLVIPLFPVGSTGSLFWMWLVVISFSQAFYNKGLSMRWRVVLLILCISTLYVSLSLGQSWASGWLPSLIAVLAVLLVGSPKLGLFTTLGGIPLIVHQLSRIQEIILINEEYSAITRQAAWVSIVRLIRQDLFLGLGPANYYWYTASQPLMGWFVYFSSHNNYIDIIAQTGLLGFASFIWFIWEIARSGLRLLSKVPRGFVHAYVCGALGGLAGTLVAGLLGDWFLPFVYNIGLSGMRSSVLTWLFLGGLVGIPLMLRGPEDNAKREMAK